jgi:hypothetical protein
MGIVTFTLLLAFLVTPSNVTQAQGAAELGVVPQSVEQSTEFYVDIVLSGFAPNEEFTAWQTFPDFTVLPRGGHGINGAGQARVRMHMDETFPVGRHYFSVRSEESQMYLIAPVDIMPPPVSLSEGVVVEVSGGTGQQYGYFSVQGYGYNPDEGIALWLTRPDGSVIDLGKIDADEGQWATSIWFDEKDQSGQYYLTGYGLNSDRTGVATFYVNEGFTVPVSGQAQLEVNRGEARQMDWVEIYGNGFAPGEIVSMWVTHSDGTVWGLLPVSGDMEGFVATNGTFAVKNSLGALIPGWRKHIAVYGSPVGKTTFTAYGTSSKLIAHATIQLWAGTEFGE